MLRATIFTSDLNLGENTVQSQRHDTSSEYLDAGLELQVGVTHGMRNAHLSAQPPGAPHEDAM